MSWGLADCLRDAIFSYEVSEGVSFPPRFNGHPKSARGYPFPLESMMPPNYAFDSFILLEGFLEASWLLEKHHLHVGSQRGGILSP